MSSFTTLLLKIAHISVALLPWAATLYLHYWLEHSSVWAVDMPFRALISVALLGAGMLGSFVLYSVLQRRTVQRR